MKKHFTFCLLAFIHCWSYGQNVVQAEYFIDTDAGYGQNTAAVFTPLADGTFSFMANLSTVVPGFHKLYVRTKDNNGKWSLTTRRNIEVVPAMATLKIVAGEYYFDTDPGFGAANPITISPQDSVILQNFNAVVSSLAIGYHKLYGRFRDMNGNWSQSLRRNVEVYKNSSNAAIVAEYFFSSDAGVGNCASTTFSNPQPDGTFAFNIPANQIPVGADTLFIRVRDSANKNWSLTQWRVGQIVLPLTLLQFEASQHDSKVNLKWKTNNEANTSHFNITRSVDAFHFTGIGRVAAKGNTTEQTSYSFQDDIAGMKPGKIYYRLEMVDKDGRFTYSNVAIVNLEKPAGLFSISPNPAKDHFMIFAPALATMKNAFITVSDLSGRRLFSQKLSSFSGQLIDISALSKGIYLVTIQIVGKTQTQKLMVD